VVPALHRTGGEHTVGGAVVVIPRLVAQPDPFTADRNASPATPTCGGCCCCCCCAISATAGVSSVAALSADAARTAGKSPSRVATAVIGAMVATFVAAIALALAVSSMLGPDGEDLHIPLAIAALAAPLATGVVVLRRFVGARTKAGYKLIFSVVVCGVAVVFEAFVGAVTLVESGPFSLIIPAVGVPSVIVLARWWYRKRDPHRQPMPPPPLWPNQAQQWSAEYPPRPHVGSPPPAGGPSGQNLGPGIPGLPPGSALPPPNPRRETPPEPQ
jgi:hypothetical protein